MNDLELMQQVERLAGPYLDRFAPGSSVPEAFWAALTANESAGLSRAKRFEPGVYAHLVSVRGGSQAAYGSITAESIVEEETATPSATQKSDSYHGEFLGEGGIVQPEHLFEATDDELRQLATSWCFVQVMGYHAIEWAQPIAVIQDPASHYNYAGRLMAGFCSRFGLDPKIDFESIGRCWNGGHPTAKTWDPAYISNLLARMKTWETL